MNNSKNFIYAQNAKVKVRNYVEQAVDSFHLT